MPEQEIIEVPAAPITQETKAHYFVYGEWSKIVEAPRLASSLDAPQVPNQQVKLGMNEAIAMHPAIFTVLIQETRPGYTVRAWSRISEELFNWWIDVARKKNAAMKAMAERNGR